MKIKIFLPAVLLQIFIFFNNLFSQQYYGLNLDTIKAQEFDMGKMWTFENPPLEYFKKEYDFIPSAKWLEEARKSALRLGNGCSASFVSADGLIMTNHHCVRGRLGNLNKEGEDILSNGFFAESIDGERVMDGLFVDQLMIIKDITSEVLSAMAEGKTDSEKKEFRDEKINKIKTTAANEYPELIFSVISFYEGGKFSLYGYKRYNDIRLVFVPELWVAKLGGDYDNFTYPRYGLDCAFLRAYDDDGNPVKSNYFFKWSHKDITEDQPVFVIGNPGSTDRIHTLAQIEYARDIRYPMLTKMLKDLYKIYYEQVSEDEAKDTKLIARLYSVGNRLKVYEGTYKALLDQILMARKKDFENTFKEAVQNNLQLNEKYGHVWKEIEFGRQQAAKFGRKIFAYNISRYYSPKYFFIAEDLINLAEQLKLPEDERDEDYTEKNLEQTIKNIFPDDFNKNLEDKLLLVQVNVLIDNLDEENEISRKMLDGKKGNHAVNYILQNSVITTAEQVMELINKGAEAILNSDDPFIYFVLQTRDELNKMEELNSSLEDKDDINNQLLGEALYAVYGDAVPPDATFSLRISDGIVKGYDYNGTRAPYKTTFYGSLDRYYSFDKKFPFNLPIYWENLPEEFDPSTTLNFISTSDIIGGNSGSAVINTDGEVVGLAFDGNIESLPNRYIYTTEANRTVCVTANGMFEAISKLYKAQRLRDEIVNGGMNK